MDKLLFIINPTAGGGRTTNIIPLIEKKMKEKNITYKIILTTEPKEATRIAEENVNLFNIIIAVGGDGTVNEVAKGMINKRSGILGIIPSGTGNDFAKAIGLGSDLEIALETLIKCKTKKIDIGKINGFSFLNIASVGFDTEVVIQTNRIKKKIRGEISYLLGILKTLLSYKKKKVNMLIDDVLYERNLVLLAVGNGNYYGGGFKVLPMAKIDDGFFHICIVKDISNFKILFLFPSVIKGQHLKYKKYVEIYKAKRVVVNNSENLNLNIDGEIVCIDNDVVFEMDNHKLDVIIP